MRMQRFLLKGVLEGTQRLRQSECDTQGGPGRDCSPHKKMRVEYSNSSLRGIVNSQHGGTSRRRGGGKNASALGASENPRGGDHARG